MRTLILNLVFSLSFFASNVSYGFDNQRMGVSIATGAGVTAGLSVFALFTFGLVFADIPKCDEYGEFNETIWGTSGNVITIVACANANGTMIDAAHSNTEAYKPLITAITICGSILGVSLITSVAACVWGCCVN